MNLLYQKLEQTSSSSSSCERFEGLDLGCQFTIILIYARRQLRSIKSFSTALRVSVWIHQKFMSKLRSSIVCSTNVIKFSFLFFRAIFVRDGDRLCGVDDVYMEITEGHIKSNYRRAIARLAFIVSRVQKIKTFFFVRLVLSRVFDRLNVNWRLNSSAFGTKLAVKLTDGIVMAREIDTWLCFVCRLLFFWVLRFGSRFTLSRFGSTFFWPLISRWFFYCLFRMSRMFAVADGWSLALHEHSLYFNLASMCAQAMMSEW